MVQQKQSEDYDQFMWLNQHPQSIMSYNQTQNLPIRHRRFQTLGSNQIILTPQIIKHKKNKINHLQNQINKAIIQSKDKIAIHSINSDQNAHLQLNQPKLTLQMKKFQPVNSSFNLRYATTPTNLPSLNHHKPISQLFKCNKPSTVTPLKLPKTQFSTISQDKSQRLPFKLPIVPSYKPGISFPTKLQISVCRDYENKSKRQCYKLRMKNKKEIQNSYSMPVNKGERIPASHYLKKLKIIYEKSKKLQEQKNKIDKKSQRAVKQNFMSFEALKKESEYLFKSKSSDIHLEEENSKDYRKELIQMWMEIDLLKK